MQTFSQVPKNRYLSEVLGTYLLVFVGPASVVLTSFYGFTPFARQELIAAVFGCTAAVAILLLGRFSGAQINPAVSAASAVAGRLRLSLLLPYVLSQAAGALLAGLTLSLLFGPRGVATSLGSRSSRRTDSRFPSSDVGTEVGEANHET